MQHELHVHSFKFSYVYKERPSLLQGTGESLNVKLEDVDAEEEDSQCEELEAHELDRE